MSETGGGEGQERERALETLFKVSNILAGSEPLEEKTGAVLREIVYVSGATEVILRVPEVGDGFRLVSWASVLPDRPKPSLLIGWGEGLSTIAYETGKPVVSDDLLNDPRSLLDTARQRNTRSGAFIPVRSEGQIIGMLTIISVEAAYFSEQRMRLLTSIGANLGALLERARSEEDERIRKQGLETLYSIASIAASQRDLDTKARAILQELVRVCRAAIVVLRVPSADDQSLTLLAAAGPLTETYTPPRDVPMAGHGSLTRAYRERHIVVSGDDAPGPDAIGSWASQGVRSVLCLPLEEEGRMLGAIAIGALEPNAFPQHLAQLLTTVGHDLGNILANARLTEEIRRRSDALQIITSAAALLAQDGSFQAKAARILEVLVRACAADVAVLRVPDENGEELVLGATAGPRQKDLSLPAAIPIAGSQAGLALRERRLVFSDDLVKDDRFTSATFDSFLAQGIRSALALPVQSGERVVGVVTFASFRIDHFTPSQIRLLSEVAESVGTLIENARLYEALRQRTAELEVTNKELEAFSYSVSHDLRSPLVGIDGFSQALLEDYGDKLEDTARQYLQRIRAGTQRIAQLIEDLLSLSRISRAEVRRERVDLSALARAVTEELRQRDPDRQVEVVIQGDVWEVCDPPLVRIALENLFANAWKFTSRHPQAKIEFGALSRDGAHVYYVRDDGAGFDQAYAEKLFGPFQRLHSFSEFPGTGIGLAIVQRIVQKLGGAAWADGVVEKGATFYFTLA